MSIGLLNTALSGLAAFQRSLETTSNNISNVNTEGYSRQRAELTEKSAQFTGSGYMGTGVKVSTISRSYDQFITAQVRSSTATFSDVDSYHAMASQIDKLLADESTGLSASMKSFFNSVNDLANDPSSTPIRRILLSEGDALANRFNSMGGRLDELEQQVNSNLQTGIADLNNYASGIAKLNMQIVDSIGRSQGQQMPNDLLDQRDELLRKVSEQVDVSVVDQGDGSVGVFIGQGQPLVLGSRASSLSLTSNRLDQSRLEISLNGNEISKYLSGGKLSGNLRFRDEMLYPAQRQLGLLAIGVATEFNEVHKSGFDLDGGAGGDFFGLGSPPVQVMGHAQDPTLNMKATFVTPVPSGTEGPSYHLGTSYQIDVTGAGDFKITNLSNGQAIGTYTQADLANAATPPNPNLGFSLEITAGGVNPGDSFEVSPSINAARGLSLAIQDPRKIAAGTVSGLAGDNRNALQLAGLESASLMQSGKLNFTQVYGQLVSEVGGMTNTALVGRTAQNVLLENAIGARESFSGVNLDEEAANLIKFQNSYQAAAQAIAVGRSMFDTLLGAVR